MIIVIILHFYYSADILPDEEDEQFQLNEIDHEGKYGQLVETPKGLSFLRAKDIIILQSTYNDNSIEGVFT